MQPTKGSLNRACKIKGAVSRRELRWLARQAAQASLILEIGCFCGRSTSALASHTTGYVISVDSFEGAPGDAHEREAKRVGPDALCDRAAENLRDLIQARRVILLKGRSDDVLPMLRSLHNKFDLAFIDGDHSCQQVLKDIDMCADLVRPGGILSGHDYGGRKHPGVKKAVNERLPGFSIAVASIWMWVKPDRANKETEGGYD